MKKYIPLYLSGLGLFILLVAAAFVIYNQKTLHATSHPLPEMILDLPLTESIQAEKAIAEITRMHNNNFPLTSGVIGVYGIDLSATLWVAGASTRKLAGQMITAMRDEIINSTGNSPISFTGSRFARYHD